MKCIQHLGTRRCENDAIPGSNYCPAHLLDAAGATPRDLLYAQIDGIIGTTSEAPCSTGDEAGEPPAGAGKWTPGSSKP